MKSKLLKYRKSECQESITSLTHKYHVLHKVKVSVRTGVGRNRFLKFYSWLRSCGSNSTNNSVDINEVTTDTERVELTERVDLCLKHEAGAGWP